MTIKKPYMNFVGSEEAVICDEPLKFSETAKHFRKQKFNLNAALIQH